MEDEDEKNFKLYLEADSVSGGKFWEVRVCGTKGLAPASIPCF